MQWKSYQNNVDGVNNNAIATNKAITAFSKSTSCFNEGGESDQVALVLIVIICFN